MKLKCDLHIHTKEDPRHQLSYSAWDLIDRASDYGYHVISITNHNTVTYSSELAGYAAEKGILLIPGVEATVMGKHVLIYGVGDMRDRWNNLSLFDLRRLRSVGTFIVAPHPYYPNYNCLGNVLDRFPYLFDAVEYSHLYTRNVNFNLRAQEFSKKHNKPILGLSDAHSLRQLDFTYSLINAKQDQESIFQAIRDNRFTIVSRPARIYTSGIVGFQLLVTFLGMHLLR